MLRIYTAKMNVGGDVDLKHLSEDCVSGFYTGADLAAVVREAALNCLRQGQGSDLIVRFTHLITP